MFGHSAPCVLCSRRISQLGTLPIGGTAAGTAAYPSSLPSIPSLPSLPLTSLRGINHRVHIFTRDETGSVYLPTQLEHTLQLYWWCKCNKRGWACTHHPYQPMLILPSWLNVRQKAAVTTLCTLWYKYLSWEYVRRGNSAGIRARICRSFKETRYRFSSWRAGTKSYLSYWPAKLHRLAKSIPRNRFPGSINIYKYGLRLAWGVGGGGGVPKLLYVYCILHGFLFPFLSSFLSFPLIAGKKIRESKSVQKSANQ